MPNSRPRKRLKLKSSRSSKKSSISSRIRETTTINKIITRVVVVVAKVDVTAMTTAEMAVENANKCTSKKRKTPSTLMKVKAAGKRTVKTRRTGNKRTPNLSISVLHHKCFQKRHCKIKS